MSTPDTALVKTREYTSAGEISDTDVSNLFFGTLRPGEETSVRILDIVVENAAKIENIRLAITECDILRDRVDEVFKVGTHSGFSVEVPTEGFPGVSSGSSDTDNNVVVPKKTTLEANESGFVVLKIASPARPVGVGACRLTWFFDYEMRI